MHLSGHKKHTQRREWPLSFGASDRLRVFANDRAGKHRNCCKWSCQVFAWERLALLPRFESGGLHVCTYTELLTSRIPSRQRLNAKTARSRAVRHYYKDEAYTHTPPAVTVVAGCSAVRHTDCQLWFGRVHSPVSVFPACRGGREGTTTNRTDIRAPPLVPTKPQLKTLMNKRCG